MKFLCFYVYKTVQFHKKLVYPVMSLSVNLLRKLLKKVTMRVHYKVRNKL